MSAACSELCGHCGRCTAAWEREQERDPFRCIVCGDDVSELDDFEPFCSQTCKDNYNGPTDGEAWSGGFAENH